MWDSDAAELQRVEGGAGEVECGRGMCGMSEVEGQRAVSETRALIET